MTLVLVLFPLTALLAQGTYMLMPKVLYKNLSFTAKSLFDALPSKRLSLFPSKFYYSTLPSNSTRFFKSAIRLVNSSQFNDWAPSHLALHGLLCTSISKPSAPAAMAALAIVGTIQAWPVAWLGSTTTGRWEYFLISGMADKSKVFLV